jgi:uncharacterized low-complexity protein
MSKKISHTPVACAVGAALVGSLAVTGVASAADNPFGMQELPSGYMQVAAKEGSCGGNMKEGSCGGKMKEGSCGGEKAAEAAGKMKEGKCGEGKCGAGMMTEEAAGKMKEGKCGEGKCGGNM